MNVNLTVRAAVMGLFLSLLASPKAGAVTFSFTEIADTSAFSLISSPSLNDRGTVAFRGGNASSSTIFTGDGEQLTTIFSYDLPTTLFGVVRDPGNTPAINNMGTVAFDIVSDSTISTRFIDEAILTAKDGEIFRSPFEFTAITRLSDFAINDSRTILFKSTYQGFESIAVINNGQLTGLVDGGGFPINGLSINNTGTVAFSGRKVDFSPENGCVRQPELGIFTTNSSSIGPCGGVQTPVILEDETFGEFTSPFINDQGTIAFAAGRSPQGAGVFTVNRNGLLTSIADTSGVFNRFGDVSLNELTTVAFEAELDAGSRGIFIGSDPVNDKVIATGDSLLGATVTSLEFVSAGLNNRQQIAFFATLDNGFSGIFRADPQVTEPQPIPEPTSKLGVLAFGAFVARSVVKRKQKKAAHPHGRRR